jgi:hypothetical protein
VTWTPIAAAEQKLVPVGRALRHPLGTDRAARAADVLDDHVLAEDLRQPYRQHTRGAVARAAGGEGNDNGHRSGWPILSCRAQRCHGTKHDADRDRIAQQILPAHVSAPLPGSTPSAGHTYGFPATLAQLIIVCNTIERSVDVDDRVAAASPTLVRRSPTVAESIAKRLY